MQSPDANCAKPAPVPPQLLHAPKPTTSRAPCQRGRHTRKQKLYCNTWRYSSLKPPDGSSVNNHCCHAVGNSCHKGCSGAVPPRAAPKTACMPQLGVLPYSPAPRPKTAACPVLPRRAVPCRAVVTPRQGLRCRRVLVVGSSALWPRCSPQSSSQAPAAAAAAARTGQQAGRYRDHTCVGCLSMSRRTFAGSVGGFRWACELAV